jgi:peptidoglycan/LPS O-acetylase OafA/YrhL
MKLNQLTFTRFLAALAIVVYHNQAINWPFNLPLLHLILSKANVGVSYFFILSGFVMIIAYGKQKAIKIKMGSYYLNRIARIYPVYLLALILAAIKIMMIGKVPLNDLLLQVFVIQSWVPGHIGKLNIPGWSLSVEALFYIAFPFLFNYYYSKYSFKAVTIFVLCLWLTTQILLNSVYLSPYYSVPPSNIHDLLFYFPLMHINEFMIGNILGFIYLKSAAKQANYDLHITAVVLALLIVLSVNRYVTFHDGLMAILFAPLILLLSLNNGKITKIFSNKYLILLGEASYSMYILQSPIKSFSSFLFEKVHLVNPDARFYTYLVVLIGISVGCYLFVEIPAKDWIKSWKSSKPVKLQPAMDSVNF